MKDPSARDPYLIITSDTHLSSPDGRWAEATAHFRSFLTSLQADPPQIMFINGDIIDNVTLDKKKPVTGTLQNWKQDVCEYLSTKAAFKHIDFRGSLGPGHDFSSEISVEYAGERLCSPRGSFCWQGFQFVWLSGNVHSFSNDPPAREECFDADDLLWLDRELASKEDVVLLFHVPLRTDDTIGPGAWAGNRSITIPTEDGVYAVIDRHLGTIKKIFNGHIHDFIESEYKGIPVHICPFYNQGHYCKVSVLADELIVTGHAYAL